MIRQVGGQWYVYSEDGRKRLSKGYPTRKQALMRLKQIEYFSKRLKNKIKETFGGK